MEIKLAFLTQNKAKLCDILIIRLVFEKKTPRFLLLFFPVLVCMLYQEKSKSGSPDLEYGGGLAGKKFRLGCRNGGVTPDLNRF
jgi:hypothetical protein